MYAYSFMYPWIAIGSEVANFLQRYTDIYNRRQHKAIYGHNKHLHVCDHERVSSTIILHALVW